MRLDDLPATWPRDLREMARVVASTVDVFDHVIAQDRVKIPLRER
jgi:hypothetical protein